MRKRPWIASALASLAMTAEGKAARPPLSKIQNQPLALAAGAADHHPLVLGLLLLGEDGVAVLGLARDHALLAGAADAELARIVDVDAFVEQHAEDRMARRDEEFPARARKLD